MVCTLLRALLVAITLLGIATGQVNDTSPDHQSFPDKLQARNAKLPIELRGHKSIVKGANNHRFNGARKDFDITLGQALDWISTTASKAK